jgi:DNA-binding response OmpR family regulator
VPVSTILVVEDCPQTRRPLTRLLKQEGYQVVTAVDAYSAAARARGDHPDLILLDVGIAPMDGLSLLALLRDELATKNIPVILVTAHEDDITIARARGLGVKDFMFKSTYQPDELLAAIRNHLQPSEQIQELQG